MFESVFQQYGWVPTGVDQFGSVLRVNVDSQEFAVKRTRQSREKLLMLHHMLSQIQQAGYPHLLPWVKTEQGEVVVEADGAFWYATQWKESLDSSPEPVSLVQSLAQFHRLSEPIVTKYPVLHTKITSSFVEDWKSKKEKLAKVRERLEEHQEDSQISAVFLSEYEKIDKMFAFAIRGIEKFLETEAGIPPRYVLCHCRVHPSNLVQDEKGYYWIDFDHAQVDHPMRDLATFLRRYTPEKGAAQCAELIQAYEEECKVANKEKKLLAIYLSYPERVIRLLQRLDHQPHLSFDDDFAEKLRDELKQLGAFQELVTQLWPRRTTARTASQRKSKSKRKG